MIISIQRSSGRYDHLRTALRAVAMVVRLDPGDIPDIPFGLFSGGWYVDNFRHGGSAWVYLEKEDDLLPLKLAIETHPGVVIENESDYSASARIGRSRTS